MKSRRRMLLWTALVSLALLTGLVGTAALVVKIEPWFRPHEPSFDEQHPCVGEYPPDFTLRDIDGKTYHLASERRARPLVIEFGSSTCPYCTRQLGALDALARKYKEKADFLFIYCKEAHPWQTAPVATYDERAQKASAFCRVMKTPQRILVDAFGDGSIQKLYGALEDSAFVLDRDGKLRKKLVVADPNAVEDALRECLGEPPVAHAPIIWDPASPPLPPLADSTHGKK